MNQTEFVNKVADFGQEILNNRNKMKKVSDENMSVLFNMMRVSLNDSVSLSQFERSVERFLKQEGYLVPPATLHNIFVKEKFDIAFSLPRDIPSIERRLFKCVQLAVK